MHTVRRYIDVFYKRVTCMYLRISRNISKDVPVHEKSTVTVRTDILREVS